jgi:hypothetical protein
MSTNGSWPASFPCKQTDSGTGRLLPTILSGAYGVRAVDGLRQVGLVNAPVRWNVLPVDGLLVRTVGTTFPPPPAVVVTAVPLLLTEGR